MEDARRQYESAMAHHHKSTIVLSHRLGEVQDKMLAIHRAKLRQLEKRMERGNREEVRALEKLGLDFDLGTYDDSEVIEPDA